MNRPLPAPVPWLAGLLALYLLGPFLAGIPELGAADWHAVDAATLGRACAVSVLSASLATLLIALGGIPLGLVLARRRGRWVEPLGFLVQLPLALPPLASGVLLLFLVGRRSLIGHLTDGRLTDSFAGIVLAETFVAAPFLIIAARSAFASIDPMLEGVAATLGSAPTATFFRVSLPIAWPALRAGILLSWLRAFGEFGATVMVAYHPYSLPVYTFVAFGSQGLPAMLPVLLPTLGAAVLVLALMSAGAARPLGYPAAARERLEITPPLRVASAGRGAGAGPDAGPGAQGRELRFRYQGRLGDFQFEVAASTRARRIAVIGASGAGKSLLLRLIAGLERADTGVLEFAGRDLSSLPPEERRLGYLPQNYCLFPHLTVMRQVRFAAASDPEVAERWVARLGLGGLERRFPAELSLGQQQRVALARALVRPADLLLLDEPFSALDAPLRSRLRREFRQLQRELDMTTILVTHDPLEAALLADEIFVMSEGRVLQGGRFEEIARRPASELVAHLLGADEIQTGLVAAPYTIDIGGGVQLEVGAPALTFPVGTRVGWRILGDRVRFHSNGAYAAEVEERTEIGDRIELYLRIGGARLRVEAGGSDEARRGGERVDIAPDSVQVWPA